MAQSTKRKLQTKIDPNPREEKNLSKQQKQQSSRSPSKAASEEIRKNPSVVIERTKRKPVVSKQNTQQKTEQRRTIGLSPNPATKVTLVKRERKEGGMLMGRTASVTQTNNSKALMQSRLKKKSPWFDSIMDPVAGGGVKIPDPIGTNTGTYQHVENVSVPVNANGVAGLRIITPYINSYLNGNEDGSNYQTTIPASTTGSLVWGARSIATNAFSFLDIPAIMKANSSQHRVVSCAVIAHPEVSTLADAGEICAFVTPFRANDNTVSYAELQYQWDSTLLPVNVHKPAIARWYPLESQIKDFNGQTEVPDTEEDGNTSYRDFIDPNRVAHGVIPWEVGVCCAGMTPSQGIVRFQICVNYEFIPISSTAMVTTEASPIDPMEEQLVSNWVSEVPVTSVISQNQASKAPTPSSVPEEQTGFGMFADVVKEIIPFAVKMLL